MMPEDIAGAMQEFTAALAGAFDKQPTDVANQGALGAIEAHARDAAVSAFVTWMAVRQLRTMMPTGKAGN